MSYVYFLSPYGCFVSLLFISFGSRVRSSLESDAPKQQKGTSLAMEGDPMVHKNPLGAAVPWADLPSPPKLSLSGVRVVVCKGLLRDHLFSLQYKICRSPVCFREKKSLATKFKYNA